MRERERATARRLSGRCGPGALVVSLLRQLPQCQPEFEDGEPGIRHDLIPPPTPGHDGVHPEVPGVGEG
ncbi:hypothetical protein ACFRCG_26105 [Embleya sp. NPDC056575]|uniref:hypothetical protein n=1 Tax=unclassified Embleya TaxID=2699296 RepID=UPI00367CE16A